MLGFLAISPPAGSPILLVALHRNCPCPRGCASDLNRFAREIAPAARLVGVVDADRTGTLREAEESGLTFEMRADPNATLLSRVEARYTLDLALVDRKGRRIGFWEGFDRSSVKAIVAKIDPEGSRLRIDVATYPSVTQTGCAIRPAKN